MVRIGHRMAANIREYFISLKKIRVHSCNSMTFSTQYNIDCILYNIDCILYNMDCILYNIDCILYNIDCILYNIGCILYNMDSIQ